MQHNVALGGTVKLSKNNAISQYDTTVMAIKRRLVNLCDKKGN